jgi:hypothetical protein
MTPKTWQFELEDGKHKVELDHGFFSGKRIIRVDSNTILESSEPQHLVFDTGGVFTILPLMVVQSRQVNRSILLSLCQHGRGCSL